MPRTPEQETLRHVRSGQTTVDDADRIVRAWRRVKVLTMQFARTMDCHDLKQMRQIVQDIGQEADRWLNVER